MNRRSVLKMLGMGAAAAPAVGKSLINPMTEPWKVPGYAILKEGPATPTSLDPTYDLLHKYLRPLYRQNEDRVNSRMLTGGFDPDVAALQSISYGTRVRMQLKLLKTQAEEAKTIENTFRRMLGLQENT